MQINRLGESAVIFRPDESPHSLNSILSWVSCIKKAQISGVRDLLPSYKTITVFYDSASISYEHLKNELFTLNPKRGQKVCGQTHRIPVCYDSVFAPDLALLAQAKKLRPEEVVSIHSEARYRVAGVGFSPGFGFLDGLSERLFHPRLRSPRVSVPAGSVGIAAQQTGIYPSETSGGWNLIGRTPLPMLDLDGPRLSRLEVGDEVIFYQISKDDFMAYHE